MLGLAEEGVAAGRPLTQKLRGIPSTALKAGAHGTDAHVLALGVEADPEPPEDFEPLADVVAWILENHGVPYLAHTYWSGLRTSEWEACEGLVGIEVWNSGCKLEIGLGDSSVHWDAALEAGRALSPLAPDAPHPPAHDRAAPGTPAPAAGRPQHAQPFRVSPTPS